uniref:Leukocyte elastase inhibitor n=1 Tax=Lepeophtheirus salmonis TaxID=72036 RepID=D3PFN3_LEPSM|nr:Leukocyte elastase inhibitor [Lepeophtheirus salmonis]
MSSDIAKTPGVKALAKNFHKFGTELILKSKGPEENAVFSSYSISNVLCMTSLGAKGDTYEQLKHALNLPEDVESLKSTYSDITSLTKSDENVCLEVANSIFPSNKLKVCDEYLEDVVKCFGSEVQSLDYTKNEEARNSINEWVSKNTNDKIPELFEKGTIEVDTSNILVNAIYFKNDWASKFDPTLTTEKEFHVTPDKIVTVPTMFAPKLKFATKSVDLLKCTIAAIPFKGERIVMYLLVPKEPFGLPELEAKLVSEEFDPTILEKASNSVHSLIQLPKFKLESTHDLVEACNSLGIEDLFDPKADLSGIGGEPGGLFVSKIVQKAVIEVSEEGSEAASASGIIAVVESAIFSDPFVVDHPFVFMIKDKATGMILMSGRVVDPSL